VKFGHKEKVMQGKSSGFDYGKRHISVIICYTDIP